MSELVHRGSESRALARSGANETRTPNPCLQTSFVFCVLRMFAATTATRGRRAAEGAGFWGQDGVRPSRGLMAESANACKVGRSTAREETCRGWAERPPIEVRAGKVP